MEKKKKKIWPIIMIVIIIAVVAVAAVVFVTKRKKSNENSGDKVYVQSIADITGSGFNSVEKYMGVVESQEMKYVDKASDKTIKEVFVKVGDEVKEGDQLFSYDTDMMNLQLKQLQLELTSINNNISTANQQIATLTQEKNEAPEEEKIDYTTQIQSIQAQINQYNYDASSKQLEIDRQKNAIDNSIVTSPMSGVIKAISSDDQSSDNSSSYSNYGMSDNQSGDSGHYMTIMALGDYRIKCTGDEMNVRSLTEGEQMMIVSRTDETARWSGSISSIDLENPVSNNNNYYGGGETTTKYSFYLKVESTDGLMLGQHVYAEPDYGQGASKEGLWLYEYYIVQGDGDTYVWTENKNGKIEKRKVTLGEYDENLMEYQITDGLTLSDCIAYPEDRIKEGMTATKNYEDVMNIQDGNDEGVNDEGSYDEGVNDEGSYDEGSYDEGSYDESAGEDGVTGEDTNGVEGFSNPEEEGNAE